MGVYTRVYEETKRALSDDETLRVALDVARALQYLHSKYIVHRDLKSHNVLLNARGAKVADFGIARVRTERYCRAARTRRTRRRRRASRARPRTCRRNSFKAIPPP